MQIDGDRIYRSPGQRLAWLLHFCKAFCKDKERARAQWLAPFIPPGGVVFDVGAHFGYLTKAFARLHGGTCRVWAFEPLPYNWSILTRVTTRFPNVTRVPYALSDTTGRAAFAAPVKRQGKIGPGLAHLGEEVQRDFILHTVETMRLDEFADQTGLTQLDFIKIDIEGAELPALRGAETSLRRWGPAIYAEVAETFTARMGYAPSELFAFLRSLGYSACRADARKNELRCVDGHVGSGDYLFRKKA